MSHLLGIFSVFNADAIRNVTLTKSGFPARYGGQLSSVLEINMKGGIDWGNLVSSLRWNYQITPKLFANTTLTYSNYEIDILAGYEYLDDEEPERFTVPVNVHRYKKRLCIVWCIVGE